MSGLLLDGRWMDAVLALIAIEGAALLSWRARSGRGPRAASLLANLCAGGFLLLAARLSISGASTGFVGAALAVSLVAHLFDLSRRWDPVATATPCLESLTHKNICQRAFTNG